MYGPHDPLCKAMAADIEKAAHQLEDRAVVVKLNAVSDSQALTAFNVATVPSLILFSENGQELARTLGYMTVNEICDWVDKNSQGPF